MSYVFNNELLHLTKAQYLQAIDSIGSIYLVVSSSSFDSIEL